MTIAKLTIVGAFALSLAACHMPDHRICDDDDGDGNDDRTVCIALIVGAAAALKLIAFNAMSSTPSAS